MYTPRFFTSEFWVCFRVCFEHSTHTPRCPPTFFPTFGFVCEFWICFEHSTHTPRCSTPTRRFFVSEFWICLRVLGLFRTFHAHTTMFNAHPTIFFRVLSLFASFGFVSNIPRTHHDAQRPPHYFFPRVLGLFRTFYAHTTILSVRNWSNIKTAASIQNYSLLNVFRSTWVNKLIFRFRIISVHSFAQRPPHDFSLPSFEFVVEF